jgi:hypothetical protein
LSWQKRQLPQAIPTKNIIGFATVVWLTAFHTRSTPNEIRVGANTNIEPESETCIPDSSTRKSHSHVSLEYSLRVFVRKICLFEKFLMFMMRAKKNILGLVIQQGP